MTYMIMNNESKSKTPRELILAIGETLGAPVATALKDLLDQNDQAVLRGKAEEMYTRFPKDTNRNPREGEDDFATGWMAAADYVHPDVDEV